MKQNEDTKQASIKGILLTGNKAVLSKTRRVSWGDATVKEFGKNELTSETNDLVNNTLNNIEEESSTSKEFSSSDCNSIERINQKSSIALNRLTINVLEQVIPLNLSDKENKPETNQFKNQRYTIANLKDAIDRNDTDHNSTNQLQLQRYQPEPQKPKAKRYTLSLQEAYGNLLKSNFDNDENDDGKDFSLNKDNNDNNNKNDKNNSTNEIKELKDISNVENEKDEERAVTPRDSFIKRFSFNSAFSDKKYNINKNKATDKEDVTSGCMSADKRITLINPKEIFQNSHSLKKNPTISHNLLISPVTKLNISFLPNSSVPLSSSFIENIEQINKRINDQINYTTEKGNQKHKVIQELEKDMENIQLKLNEFIEEETKIEQQKTQLQQSLIKLANDYDTLSSPDICNSTFKNIFGIKVLNVNIPLNRFELLVLNRIKLFFALQNISELLVNDPLSLNASITILSIDFEIINKDPNIPENIKSGHILKTVYNDLIKETIASNPLSLTDFRYQLKGFIKISASFLYLLDTLSVIFTISNNTNLKYEKEKKTIKVMFDILNKQGFKLNFLFEIAIKDAFMGVYFRDLEWINVYMPQSSFVKLQNKFLLLKTHIEKYLGLKDPTQILYRNLFYTINDNVRNL